MNVMCRAFTVASMTALVGATPLHADTPAPLQLGFGDAVRLATREAAASRIAGIKADEASARVGQARSVLLPSLSGSAQTANRTVDLAAQGFKLPTLPDRIGPFDAVDARAKVSETVLDPSSWRKIGAARENAAQTIAERDASEESVAQTAALAYLRAARARALAIARESDLELARELSSVAEAQLSAGTSPQIDVTRAHTQVATSRGELLLARHDAERSIIDLARALGIDPATPIVLADTLGPALGASSIRDSALAGALTRRPELIGETAKRARAEADRGAIALERFGRLDASADWGWSGQHASDALWTRDYALAYSLPIFDGLRRETRLQEQHQIVKESDVRLRDLHDQVSADVAQARIAMSAAEEQSDIAHERLSLAQEELDESRDRFANGVASNLELIQAQSNLIQAREAEVDARFGIASARVELARALGAARDLH